MFSSLYHFSISLHFLTLIHLLIFTPYTLTPSLTLSAAPSSALWAHWRHITYVLFTLPSSSLLNSPSLYNPHSSPHPHTFTPLQRRRVRPDGSICSILLRKQKDPRQRSRHAIGVHKTDGYDKSLLRDEHERD
jgi:hypothetical protein